MIIRTNASWFALQSIPIPNTTKENKEVDIESRQEAQHLYQKYLLYYTINRAFVIFPQTPIPPNLYKKGPIRRVMLTPIPCLAYAFRNMNSSLTIYK